MNNLFFYLNQKQHEIEKSSTGFCKSIVNRKIVKS